MHSTAPMQFRNKTTWFSAILPRPLAFRRAVKSAKGLTMTL